MIIHLVRHGQASFGAENYDLLSPLGERQARLFAEHAGRLSTAFDAIVTGNMVRHRQTAEPMGARTGVYPEFDEFDAGAVWNHEMARMIREDPAVAADMQAVLTDRLAFARVFEKMMRRWAKGEIDPKVGENWRAFLDRVRRGIERVVAEHAGARHVAVFTSAGPVAAAMRLVLDISDEKTMEIAFAVRNASVTRLRAGSGNLALLGFNDTAHLEITGDKTLLTLR